MRISSYLAPRPPSHRLLTHACQLCHGQCGEDHADNDNEEDPDPAGRTTVRERYHSPDQGDDPAVTQNEAVAEDGEES